MLKNLKRHILFFMVCWFIPYIYAQSNAIEKNPGNQIHTPQIFKKGWPLSYPIVQLNSNEKIVLTFDFLGNSPEFFDYKIVHCDAGWNPDDLWTSDYMEGFEYNPLQNYESSFNTYEQYFHYTLEIPNQDVVITRSGNYLLEVYPSGETMDPVLVKRFMVTENLTTIEPALKRPVSASLYQTSQQINTGVNLGGLQIDDPYNEIILTISKNNNPLHTQTIYAPSMVAGNYVEFYDAAENIFPGGNEYRAFDIKSVKYQSPRIMDIQYHAPYHHIYLHNDESRRTREYFSDEDLNGKYYVEIQEGQNSGTDADYVIVHFSLLWPVPEIEGDFYVFGHLSNWQLQERCIMEYNFERKAYEASILVKQGYYNYKYVFLPEQGDPNARLTEGSYFETENDYLIQVYYRDRRQRFDRLIGTRTFNTHVR